MLHAGIAHFAEPTLLLLGDTNSLAWLADQIEAGQDMEFASMPDVVLQLDVDLHVHPTVREGALRRRNTGFVWEISMAEASRFAAQVREVARASSPAHAYLDPESNSAAVQVVASLGEYDAEKVLGLGSSAR